MTFGSKKAPLVLYVLLAVMLKILLASSKTVKKIIQQSLTFNVLEQDEGKEASALDKKRL